MYDMNQVFGLDATVEVPVMPGVTMSKPVSRGEDGGGCRYR